MTKIKIPQVVLLSKSKSTTKEIQDFNSKTIKDLLIGLEQVKSSKVTEYKFE